MKKACVVCGGEFEARGRGSKQVLSCSAACRRENVNAVSAARYARRREVFIARQRDRNERNREIIRLRQRERYHEQAAAARLVRQLTASGLEALR